MIFNPKTSQLFKSDGTFLKTVHCPHALTPEQLQAIHGNIEGRHCSVCRSTVHRLDNMTDDQAEALLKQKPAACVFATPEAKNIIFLKERAQPTWTGEPPPVVRTLRSLQAIVAAQEQGAHVLLRKVCEPPPEGEFQYQIYQHSVTGKIWFAEDQRQGGPMSFYDFVVATEGLPPEEQEAAYEQHEREAELWKPVSSWFFARPDQVFPYAGYVIPPGLAEGAEVWVEDLAEDRFQIFWNQGPADRIVSSFANWVNGDLVFPPLRECANVVG